MAANTERGEYDVVIDGATYTLVMKTAGLIALQQRFSTADSLADVGVIMQRAILGDVACQVAAFWASLQKYHPDITYDQAMQLLDVSPDALIELRVGFATLAKSMRPDPQDRKELAVSANPPKARAKRRGTGATGTSSRRARA